MKKILRSISLIFAAIGITAVIGTGLLIEPCIKISGFKELDPSRLDNIKNTLIISGEEDANAFFVPIEKVNNYTINAFLCAEDKHFYEHEGIDYYRILTAAIKDLKDGAFTQGASTITQQLVKNTHLTGEKSIKRKIQEIRLARAIERKYTKNEILEMYLNILYFGNGTYGIGSAARNFFDKAASDLTAKESAMLAAIINNPSKYSPYEHPDNLNRRALLILKLMKDNNKITNEEYESAKNQEVTLKKLSLCNKYRCFVIREACEILGCTEQHLLHGDYKIVCNLDNAIQRHIRDLISGYDYDCLQVIVIDNETGKIIAHEAKYKGDPSALLRSPGSAIKPIVSYAPAIEKGIIVPITPVLDEKTEFGDYCPSNYKGKYYGWVSCEYALKESLNIPAVKLLDAVGLDYAKQFAAKLGIKTDDEGLALALGGMKYGASLKDIASAYSSFARGGLSMQCSYIKAIYKGDELIYSSDYSKKRIMKEETAYLINEMLNECAKSGTAKILNAAKLNIAAKTGTVGNSSGNSDAYCIAYNPSYTVGVHIMDQNSKVTGGGVPTKIAKQLFMSDINSTETFKIPQNIVKIRLNAPLYYKMQKIVRAQNSLPKKDTITASFPIYNLPMVTDERSDYEKGLDFFDMNNFAIVDSFDD